MSEKLNSGPSKFYIYSLSLIFVFGLILRLRGLDFQSFWQDELSVIARSNRETWQSQYGDGSTYFCCPYEGLLIRPWTSLFGHSEFISRMPMALSGSVLIIVTSEIGRKLHSEGTGIISASFVAVSYSSILYSQEARHYIITTLFLWSLFLIMINKDSKSNSTPIQLISLVLVFFTVLNSYNSRIALFIGIFFLTVYNYTMDRISNQLTARKRLVTWLFSKNQIRVTRIAIIAIAISFSTVPQMLEHLDQDVQSHINFPDPDEPLEHMLQGFLTCDEYCRLGQPDSPYVNIVYLSILLSPILCALDFLLNRKNDPILPEIFLFGTSLVYLGTVLFLSDSLGTLYLHRYNVMIMPGFLLIASLSIRRFIDIASHQFTKIEYLGNEETASLFSLFVAALIFTHGANLMIKEYSYYEVVVKEDFRGISEHYIDLEENLDAYSVASSNRAFINYYLDRWGVDQSEYVEAGWGTCSVWEGVFLHIEEKQYENVIYHADLPCRDDSFIEFLNLNYTLMDQRFSHGQELYLFSMVEG